MISVLPSPLFSILLTLFSLFSQLRAHFSTIFGKNETFDVKCGLNADHFSSLIRRHSTNFSNCGSACKHCTCWQPRCHNEFLLVGSINALHIKFQGWTFIATFSTAYQSSNRDPFLLVCYQSSQFMRKHECISRIFGLRLGLGTESSPGQDLQKPGRRSSLATLFDSPFKLGSLFVRLQDVIHWLKGSKFFEVTGALRVSDSERN